jgi:hypothetical protein
LYLFFQREKRKTNVTDNEDDYLILVLFSLPSFSNRCTHSSCHTRVASRWVLGIPVWLAYPDYRQEWPVVC